MLTFNVKVVFRSNASPEIPHDLSPLYISSFKLSFQSSHTQGHRIPEHLVLNVSLEHLGM